MSANIITDLKQLKGLVGLEVGVTDWKTITQERINVFADATEDHQWIHLDTERASTESPYGTTVAHGFLNLSLLPVFIKDVVNVNVGFNRSINYGLNRVRFPAPVPAGSKIRARVGLQSLEEIEGGLQFVWMVRVEVEKSDKPSVVAEWVTRSYR